MATDLLAMDDEFIIAGNLQPLFLLVIDGVKSVIESGYEIMIKDLPLTAK